jgi:hypothetical protein
LFKIPALLLLAFMLLEFLLLLASRLASLLLLISLLILTSQLLLAAILVFAFLLFLVYTLFCYFVAIQVCRGKILKEDQAFCCRLLRLYSSPLYIPQSGINNLASAYHIKKNAILPVSPFLPPQPRIAVIFDVPEFQLII